MERESTSASGENKKEKKEEKKQRPISDLHYKIVLNEDVDIIIADKMREVNADCDKYIEEREKNKAEEIKDTPEKEIPLTESSNKEEDVEVDEQEKNI